MVDIRPHTTRLWATIEWTVKKKQEPPVRKMKHETMRQSIRPAGRSQVDLRGQGVFPIVELYTEMRSLVPAVKTPAERNDLLKLANGLQSALAF